MAACHVLLVLEGVCVGTCAGTIECVGVFDIATAILECVAVFDAAAATIFECVSVRVGAWCHVVVCVT